MAITRTVDWRLRCQVEGAIRWAEHGLKMAGFENVRVDGNQVSGSNPRSFRKNRWASQVTANVSSIPGHGYGSEVTWRIEMPLGTAHFQVLDSIAEHVPDEVFDDQGLKSAVERLGKAGRLFGRQEVSHFHNLIRSTEHVLELGQGRVGDKQGIVVLTTERLFFYERGLMGSESTQEFALPAIQALGVSKKLTGERIEVAHSGTKAEITNLQHGQADSIVRAFHTHKRNEAPARGPAQPASATTPDPFEQLQKLAQLRDAGILTPEEFETKKAEILSRM